MNKKVIAINSSRRKGNTYGILAKLKEELGPKGIQVDIINLSDYEIKECLGCELCLRENICPLKDKAYLLMEKLRDYDGIIISSPVYMGGVSGKLKVFIDRTCRWFHRPELVGKPVLLVATTAASSLKETLKFLEKTAVQWGAIPCGSIGRTVKTLGDPIERKEYDNFVKYLFMERKAYRPDFNQLIFFQVQRVLAEKILEIDKRYWEEKEWNNKLFYFECSINPLNGVLVKTFYKILSNKVVKVGE